MCVQGLVLLVLVVIRVILCVCLWGVFLFLCAGGACLCRGSGFGCVEGQLVLLGPVVYFI